MANLSISISISEEELPRMLAAFARRFKNPSLTEAQMLAALKANAINQINTVVVAEEQAALDEQKSSVTPLNLS